MRKTFNNKISVFVFIMFFTCVNVFSQTLYTFTVTNTSDNAMTPPAGSLRAAVNQANAIPGGSQAKIVFNISGPAPQTIQLNSPLPAITSGTITVDGAT